ncbi:right-handed parallel beta-helix repeat-containing protein [Streptomyces sp. APSN-46.1]|uniref:right-handed parallel beta-helix repeat-containing protein n=1 Tax=Streptomyces sp. APSN-46.1 TaxID=2929049 RepID=UPI001FB3116B|nr:right-handed parallel beta-helix repeat-containing protein [Streptomyces sp. APSN-46.1]MCJ1677640.1 right-handed parallel beta-helix repeat-containing protein [Streptomyces sp. APSN-46.1]
MPNPLIRTAARLGLCVITAIAVCPLAPASASADGSHNLVVPRDYPTIQAAVNAADPGDRITVQPGIYREQVVIGKYVSITGSGDRKTTIQAPQTLTPGDDGGTSIVEIHDGASVALSRLAVSGPGSGTCDNGALGSGIRVLGGAHLDLDHAAVTHITDTPAAPCFRSANAILIGDVPTGTGSATIHNTKITDYQGAGVVVLNEGSTATIENTTVTGHPKLSTDGIEFVAGGVGRVTRSTVSDNQCREPDPGCGPDFFNEFQHAGIVADTPGTVVQHNRLVGNQVGIYVAGGGIDIGHNDIQRSSYVGIALQDGSFTVRKDRIRGGVHGVAVVAASVDTHAVLDGVRITQTSGAPVETFECCGFTATATVNP